MISFMRFLFIYFFLFLFIFPLASFAQSPIEKEAFYKAEVVEVLSEGETYVPGGDKVLPYQKVTLRILDGDKKGQTITVEHGKLTTIREDQKVVTGEKIVLLQLPTPQGVQYQIVDRFRLDSLLPLIVLFFVLILVLSRWKGLGSILGLFVSLAIILFFIVPQILSGRDALVISILGALFIMITTIYLAHGFSRKIHIAVFATFISLLLTGWLSYLFVNIVHLTGLGNDDAFSLQFGQTGIINFKGLFLGGIIIGALGVLDDITTGLSATIEELHKAKPDFTFVELVKSGLRVGSEHISSLVNTLVLAYAGVALPLFLFLILNPQQQPLWVILNSELLVEEVVRTLAGSMGLVMAVPITTVLAAWIVTQKSSSRKLSGRK